MPQPTILAVGELLVEFVSHQKGCGLLDLAEYTGPYPSGAPAICIEQAARTGASAQIFGSVGADNFGKALLDRLQQSGVVTSGVQRFENHTTGVAFVSYYEDGSRTFVFHLNNTAADAFGFDDMVLPSGPLLLHVSGSSLGNPDLRLAIEKAAEVVIERGGQISCDPNARPELMGDHDVRALLINLIEKSTYLFPSDVDLEFLYPGLTTRAAVEQLLATGVENIALTQGEQGCTIYSKSAEPVILHGHVVEEIDPTGAGDCFCGTFLSMIVQGNSIDKSGRYANAAGAIAVTKRGPMEGNSSLSMIEEFMRNNPLTTANQRNKNA